MSAQLIVTVIVEAIDGRVFDHQGHSFDLAIGPGMVGLRQPVCDPVVPADHVEAHRPGVAGILIPWLLGERDSIIGSGQKLVVKRPALRRLAFRQAQRPE